MTETYENRSARAHAPADDEAGLRDALDADRTRERRDAALALVDRANDGLADATAAALADRAASDESVDVRQFAVEALGAGGEREDAVRAALDDPDEWVRAEAVVALSRVAPGDSATLRDALDDDSGWVRRNAIIALGKTEAAEIETFADRLKNDPHPAVREYAATYLGELTAGPEGPEGSDASGGREGREQAVRLLAAVLARDPEAFVRAKAATALGELGTDRAEEALETQGITDRSDDVRRAAKTALAAARGVDPDRLDVEVDGGPPGGGPQSPRETPGGGIGPERGTGPGPDAGRGPGPGNDFR